MTEMEMDFKRLHDFLEDNSYKILMAIKYNPEQSFFKHSKNDRVSFTVHACKNCDTCEAYKKGHCLCRNVSLGLRCPFIYSKKITGPTLRAKSAYNFLDLSIKYFGDYIYKPHNLTALNVICPIGNGDITYLPIYHLNNYVNPLSTILEMEREYFIPTKNFNEKTVNILLNYHPQAMFGGEIKTYQTEEVPKLVRNLKANYPELYKNCVAGTQWDLGDSKESYIGKKAYVKTLLPGKVAYKYDKDIWYWDGTYMECLKEEADKEATLIKPNDKTVVTIIEADTVDIENTEFSDL